MRVYFVLRRRMVTCTIFMIINLNNNFTVNFTFIRCWGLLFINYGMIRLWKRTCGIRVDTKEKTTTKKNANTRAIYERLFEINMYGGNGAAYILRDTLIPSSSTSTWRCWTPLYMRSGDGNLCMIYFVCLQDSFVFFAINSRTVISIIFYPADLVWESKWEQNKHGESVNRLY